MPATRSDRSSQRRKVLAEAPLARQQLQEAGEKRNGTTATLKSAFSVTKRQVDSPAKIKLSNSYTTVKSALSRSTAPSTIVGRESEQKIIREFLNDSVGSKRGGSLYISGNPGTGKTACLQAIIKKTSASFVSVFINCVAFTRPDQVYTAILDAFNIEYRPKDLLSPLEELALSHNNAFLLVLDEIDSLVSGKHEVLYKLFELAAHPKSHMALVGIANALDLTDRFLPRLQSRGCEPRLLNFNPYQVKEIVSILQNRLYSVSGTDGQVEIIQKAALELCARKVAATSGDLRKALDVCRQAIDAALIETKRKTAAAIAASDKENGPPTQSAMPKITIMHIARVLTNLNGSPIAQKLEALNFQQKLVLCSIISLSRSAAETSASKKAVNAGYAMSAIFSEYGSICKLLGFLAPVTRSEFMDLVSMMETQGVVSIDIAKGSGRSRKRITSTTGSADDRIVRLAVDEAAVRKILLNTSALKPLL